MEYPPWPSSELGCCSHADSERKALGVQPHPSEKSQTSRFRPVGCPWWDKGPVLQDEQQLRRLQGLRKSDSWIGGCLATSGPTREAGAGEKFFQKVWLCSQPVPSSSHMGPRWCGSAECRGDSHHCSPQAVGVCLGGGGRNLPSRWFQQPPLDTAG